MGIREKLNDNPGVSTGLAVAIILLLLVFLGYNLFGGGGGNAQVGDDSVYYATGDGTGYETGPATDQFARDAQGQPKARAHVFRFEGAEPFVAYVERLSPKALVEYDKLQKEIETNPTAAMMIDELIMSSKEVKRPGTDKWYPAGGSEGAKITALPQMDGKNAQPVYPGQ